MFIWSVVIFAHFAVATKTIIISADGFRWDYYGKFPTPGLDRIKAKGVHVKNLINSFATITFPNHFTLATGMYEESHGIVDNEMYDPVFDESFSMQTVDPKWWDGAEPIWVLAEKQGKKTVCVNWVGCGVEGIRPTHWNPYDGTLTYEERVDRVVEKLTEDSELALLYFEDPDHTCHMFGPDSPELAEAISRVDSAIMYLLDKINLDETNVIFTSDHGGYGVSKDRTIALGQYSSVPFQLAASGAVAHVWPTDGSDGSTEQLLTDLQRMDASKARCYKKASVPHRLHYSHNRRIAPVICIAELGWTLVHTEEEARNFKLKGSHGYDASQDPDSPMRPVFIAAGPDLINSGLRGTVHEPFKNVHIFPLLAHIAKIPEAAWPPINGTLDAVVHLLKPMPSTGSLINQLFLGASFTVGLGLIIATA